MGIYLNPGNEGFRESICSEIYVEFGEKSIATKLMRIIKIKITEIVFVK